VEQRARLISALLLKAATDTGELVVN